MVYCCFDAPATRSCLLLRELLFEVAADTRSDVASLLQWRLIGTGKRERHKVWTTGGAWRRVLGREVELTNRRVDSRLVLMGEKGTMPAT